jgi:hypothetical protein
VPSYSPTKIVKMIKSLTAREIFHRVPTVKKRLWGGELGRVRPLLSELVGRRPAGGRSQKKSEQQKTRNNGPEQFHRRTSFAL